jgi:hypothetical protein
MKRGVRTISIALALVLTGLGGVLCAQLTRGRARNSQSGNVTDIRIFGDSGTPEWEINPHFKSDLFTFVRIQYSSAGSGGGGYREPWTTDAPDSDDNFSFRLQQMTSLKVQPHGRILQLTDPELYDYPFIYMLEIQRLRFSQNEVECLRKYLLNGGFLMVDDHWGENAYQNIRRELLRVLPGHEPVELEIDHPIFHCVFDLKQKPQVPGINWARSHRAPGDTSENYSGPPHYRAVYDNNGRIVVLLCTNTDLGDGWEREGEEEWYFHQFSEKLAYPMGINIVFWAMTH